MKIFVYTLSLLTLVTFSCNKDTINYFESGKTKGMNITNHDISVKANFADEDPKQIIELDLDANGQMDLRFISYQDSVTPYFCGNYSQEELDLMEYEGSKFTRSFTMVEILNGSFTLAVQENSNKSYETHSDYYDIERPSGTASIMEINSTKNEPSSYQKSSGTFSTVKSFGQDELISETQLFLNPEEELDMSSAAFEYSYFYRNHDAEVTYGIIQRYERNHFEVPSNELRYLMFKKADKWGWISFEITEENRITIFESAISKR
ncbi:MAG: hypothetical protein GQ574_25575 [Crocinitomix sp.]|nr:hypothetical protein [Crocinitomix sp.]